MTGIFLLYPQWEGFQSLDWKLQAKLSSVILLTLAVASIHRLEAQEARGHASSAKYLPIAGKVASLSGTLALVFAVLAFR